MNRHFFVLSVPTVRWYATTLVCGLLGLELMFGGLAIAGDGATTLPAAADSSHASNPTLNTAGLKKLLLNRDVVAFTLELSSYDLQHVDEKVATQAVAAWKAAKNNDLAAMQRIAAAAASNPRPEWIPNLPSTGDALRDTLREAEMKRELEREQKEYDRTYGEFLAALEPGLQDSIGLKIRAEKIVNAIGPAAAPGLAKFEEWSALERLGPEAVPPLVASFRNPKSPNQVVSYWALRREFPMTPVPSLPTPVLLKIVGDSGSPYRSLALFELASRNDEAGSIVPELLKTSGTQSFEDDMAMTIGYLAAREDASIAWLKAKLNDRFRTFRRDDILYRPNIWEKYVKPLAMFARHNDRALDILIGLVDAPPEPNIDWSATMAEDRTREFRNVVAGQLGGLGPRATKAIPTLANLLQTKPKHYSSDGGSSQRRIVVWALGRIGMPAKAALEAAREAGISEAATGLHMLRLDSHLDGRPSVAEAAQRLNAADIHMPSNEESKLYDAIEDYGDDAKAALPEMVARIRKVAVLRYWHLAVPRLLGAEAGKKAMDALLSRMQRSELAGNGYDWLDAATVQQLGCFGSQARPLVPWLITQAKSANSGRQCVAIYALGKIAVDDPQSRSEIEKVLRLLQHDADRYCREFADESLHNIAAVSWEGLQRGLSDHDANNIADAIRRLGELGPAAKTALPALLMGLRNRRDDRLAAAAVIAIVKIAPDDKTLIQTLPYLRRAPSDHIRHSAEEASAVIHGAAMKNTN